MKRRMMSARAKPAHVDPRRLYALRRELIDIRAPEVEVRPPPGFVYEPAIQKRGGVSGCAECLHDLLAHLAAARAE